MIRDFSTILKKIENLSFIVIGDAMLDVYIRGLSQRLSREAPVPIIAVEDRQERAGGAANTAINVAQFGAHCYFMSTIGEDPEGDSLIQILDSNGVHTETLIRENKRTLSKQRVCAQDQQLVRFDYGNDKKINKSTEHKLITALSQLHQQCDGIIISDYEYGTITEAIREELYSLQKILKKIIVVDAKHPQKYSLLSPTLVKPNFAETMDLLQIKDYPTTNRIAFIDSYKDQILEKTGACIVAVTLDKEGSIVFQQKSNSYQIPTTPMDNAKAAGAGDTYTAMFALSLAAQGEIFTAAHVAAVAAGIVIQKDLTAICTKSDLYFYYYSQQKQLQYSDMPQFIQSIRTQKKRIVFTNGCFDIIHSGHITYLQEAKNLGDILIVGLNTDESVKRLKGKERPINTLLDRMHVLSGLASVDYVIPFAEDTPIALIKKICPDIYVKGGDYTRETLPEVPIVERLGGRLEIIPYVKDHSTTNIIRQIQEKTSGKSMLHSYE